MGHDLVITRCISGDQLDFGHGNGLEPQGHMRLCRSLGAQQRLCPQLFTESLIAISIKC